MHLGCKFLVLLLLTGCYADELTSYTNDDNADGQDGGYRGRAGSGGDNGGGGEDGGLSGLQETIPGVPGEDYPIYAAVPDSEFSCDGRVEGGKYADPTTECQVFHFCALADTEGGLITYSFLCPNGTVFNQQYFICDWWFNVDCAEAESLYALNDEIAASNNEDSLVKTAGSNISQENRPDRKKGGGRGNQKYNTAGGPAASNYGAPRDSDNNANGRDAGNGYATSAGNSYGSPSSGGGARVGGLHQSGTVGESYGAPRAGLENSFKSQNEQSSYGTGSSAGNGNRAQYSNGGLSGYRERKRRRQ